MAERHSSSGVVRPRFVHSRRILHVVQNHVNIACFGVKMWSLHAKSSMSKNTQDKAHVAAEVVRRATGGIALDQQGGITPIYTSQKPKNLIANTAARTAKGGN